MYELKQYGSAVLIAKDIVLTNAHVITDDDNKPTLHYELCQTISEDKSPVCFSPLQLLSYDTRKDLALLKIITPVSEMPSPVSLWSGTLSVGDRIDIIGYPANGGNTITTTQWTIAWFEEWYYKTDANIDWWNSGGGGFDQEGNLIGIPTFVVGGYSTMWYLIPSDMIKTFVSSWGTVHRGTISPVFTKRLQSQYSLVAKSYIDNPLFTTPFLSGYALSLVSAIEKQPHNFYEYGLQDANEWGVRLRSLIATDNAAIQKYIANEIKTFQSRGMKTQKISKKIWNINRQVIVGIDDDNIIYEYIQSSSTNKTYLEFGALLDTEDAKGSLEDILAFIEGITVKRSTSKPQVLNVPSLKLSSKRWVSITKWIEEDGLHIRIFPNSTAYTMNISAEEWTKEDTIKKTMNEMESLFDDIDIDYTTETSKYPSKVWLLSMTDEEGNSYLLGIGLVKAWSKNIFIGYEVEIHRSTGKKEAIAMIYKTLGLQ